MMEFPSPWIVALAVAISSGASAQIVPADQSPPTPPFADHYHTATGIDPIDDQSQAEDVALAKDRHERMTVSVSLDGAGPYEFLVDTGADRSAVSRKLASSLQLRRGASAKMHSVTGAAMVETAKVAELRLSDQVAPRVEAALLDATAMGADGIVGVDALRSRKVLFDFKAGTMTISPSQRETVVADPGAIVITGQLRQGRLLLTKASSGGRKINVVVDTGSEMTIANRALRDKLLTRGQLKPLGTVELQSVTGQKMFGEIMMLNKLEIGGVELADLLIVFAEAHTFEQLDLKRQPALLLGMNAMRAFDKVSIDFARRKVRIVMPERSELDTLRLAGKPPPTLLPRLLTRKTIR